MTALPGSHAAPPHQPNTSGRLYKVARSVEELKGAIDKVERTVEDMKGTTDKIWKILLNNSPRP